MRKNYYIILLTLKIFVHQKSCTEYSRQWSATTRCTKNRNTSFSLQQRCSSDVILCSVLHALPVVPSEAQLYFENKDMDRYIYGTQQLIGFFVSIKNKTKYNWDRKQSIQVHLFLAFKEPSFFSQIFSQFQTALCTVEWLCAKM